MRVTLGSQDSGLREGMGSRVGHPQICLFGKSILSSGSFQGPGGSGRTFDPPPQLPEGMWMEGQAGGAITVDTVTAVSPELGVAGWGEPRPAHLSKVLSGAHCLHKAQQTFSTKH